jgi:hypothetical protein
LGDSIPRHSPFAATVCLPLRLLLKVCRGIDDIHTYMHACMHVCMTTFFSWPRWWYFPSWCLSPHALTKKTILYILYSRKERKGNVSGRFVS